MEMILFIAVLVLAVLHFQLRARIQALETRLEEEGLGPTPPVHRLEPRPDSAAFARTLAETGRTAATPATPPDPESAALRPQPPSFVAADTVDAEAAERSAAAADTALLTDAAMQPDDPVEGEDARQGADPDLGLSTTRGEEEP